MTRSEARLQSQIALTPEDMLEISHEINRRFAPKAALVIPDTVDVFFNGVDHFTGLRPARSENKTVFHSIHKAGIGLTSKDLYDISREIGGGFTPDAVPAGPELFLLPVDPDHLYAYWELGETQNAILSQLKSETGLALRVYWRTDENPVVSSSNVWFDVAVHEFNARQKVRVPLDDSAYSAALGKINEDNSFEAYIHSNIIRVPPRNTRITPFQFQVHQNRPKETPESAHSQALPMPPSAQGYKKKALIEYKLSDILGKHGHARPISEMGWLVKLHFHKSAAYEAGTLSGDSRLKDLLKAKVIDIELIPEPFYCEKKVVQGKSASGLGIN